MSPPKPDPQQNVSRCRQEVYIMLRVQMNIYGKRQYNFDKELLTRTLEHLSYNSSSSCCLEEPNTGFYLTKIILGLYRVV